MSACPGRKPVRFDRVEWSDAAEAGLGDALGNDAAVIRDQVRAGEAALFHAKGPGTWMVTRLEGRELVIVCFAGRGTRAACHSVMAYARSLGVTSLRYHTRHAWIIELLADWRPQAVEYVIRL